MAADLPSVCFVAGTLGRGGAERQLYYQLRALQQHGVRPRLLCLTRGEHYEAPIQALGIPVKHVGEASGRIRRVRAILRALRSDPPEIIQSAHFFTNLYAFAAARRLRCQEIGAVRSDVSLELGSHGWLGRRGLFWPRTVAANSQMAIDNAVRAGARESRLVLLPNVVDTDEFRPVASAAQLPFRILFVGRLIAAKRVAYLVDVLTALRNATTAPWHATVVGDGPERATIERLIAVRGLAPDHVTLAGESSDPRPHYARSHGLVLTSGHEGSPNVVLEAMACGLPVVATDVGGVSELVDADQTGLLFGLQDLSGMVDGLARLIASPEDARRLGLAGRQRVETERSTSGLIPSLERLYHHARR